jgi:branched-chain amino acid transport system substrate-binding protein
MNTIVGPIKYNNKNYSETPLVGGQWQKGQKWPWEVAIINNTAAPNIKRTSTMAFPLPK